MERVYKTSVPEPSARPPPGKEIQVTEGTRHETAVLSTLAKKKDYPLNNMVQFCFFFFSLALDHFLEPPFFCLETF